MTFARALQSATAASLASFVGVAVVSFAAQLIWHFTAGLPFPVPSAGPGGVAYVGLAMLVGVFVAVGLMTFTPTAYLRLRLRRLGLADVGVHCILALVVAATVSWVVFAGDLVVFAVAAAILLTGGWLGIIVFRHFVDRSFEAASASEA